jgi:glutamate-1-semialdehyde 2,1-aminomutase
MVVRNETSVQAPARDARWTQFASSHEQSAELHKRARALMPGGISHNIRRTRPFPLFIQRGEGPFKWDVDGNRYLDYAMGSASLLLGHDPACTRAALQEIQGYVPAACHELELEWAQLVCTLVPSAEQVRFCASGTEATMLAARIARAATGRSKIVRLEGHYHGWNDYFMLGHRAPFDTSITDGVLDEVLAGTYVAPDDNRAAVEELLTAGDVAAVFVEPSGASWGTVPLAREQLSFFREVTARTGTLLVFDETITGFRFSPGGMQELAGIDPDLTALGKILTGGLQGAAVAGHADVLDVVRPGRSAEEPHVVHFGTFNGHPLPAAVGVRTLRKAADGQPQAAADSHAEELRAGIQSILEELGIDGFVYGESSTFHIYLRGADAHAEREASPATTTRHEYLAIPSEVIDPLHCELRLRGLDLMSYNGGVASCTHGRAHLGIALEAFDGALRTLRDDGIVAAR